MRSGMPLLMAEPGESEAARKFRRDRKVSRDVVRDGPRSDFKKPSSFAMDGAVAAPGIDGGICCSVRGRLHSLLGATEQPAGALTAATQGSHDLTAESVAEAFARVYLGSDLRRGARAQLLRR